MATISNTPRPGYVWDSTDNVWYPIGVGGHSHPDYITQATAVNPTIIDAKGDIITATAADTPARLAVGNNGETLVADSSTSTGLRYQTGNGLAQGIINGGMDIWQRGTSFTNGGQFTADRWYFDISASTVTSTRESTIVPAGFQYSWKINKSAGSGSATAIQQVIETGNAIQYAGKTVALSVYFAADASTSFSPGLDWSSTADNARSGSWTSITPTVDGTTTVSTTTFVRITSTFAVPSTAKSLRINFAPNLASGVNIYLTGVQLELGSVATPFRKAGGTIQGELDACQRYFFNLGSGTGKVIGTGNMYTAAQLHATVAFPTTMRTAPTLTLTGGTDYFGFDRASTSDYYDSMSIYNASTNSCLLYTSSGVSGTAGDAGYCYTNNAAASVAFSAEL